MTDNQPLRVHRKNYQRPAFQVERVELEFDLGEEETIVRSRLDVRREAGAAADEHLLLLGEDLELRAVWGSVAASVTDASGEARNRQQLLAPDDVRK